MSEAPEVARLSPSVANTLLQRSPLHAWSQHRLLGGVEKEVTPQMEKGKVIEAMLLGGEAGLTIIDADDFRKKEAQAARDAARAAGLTPVLIGKMEGYQKAVDAIRENAAAFGITFKGDKQVTTLWNHTVNLFNGPHDVPCKGILDIRNLEEGFIDDLKTTENAHPLACVRKILTMGYDVQGAGYKEGTELNNPKAAGRLRVRMIFCETTAPYAVQPVWITGEILELGQQKWDRACKAWGECVATKKWPSYSSTIYAPDVPTWAKDQEAIEAMRVEMEQEESAK